MKYENLNEALNDYNWIHINTEDISVKDEILNFIDLQKFNETGRVVSGVKSNKCTILVLDNKKWNETYLIDKVSTCLLTSDFTISDLNLVYVDSIYARTFIEYPKQYNEQELSDIVKNLTSFEKHSLHPMVIVVNPKADCVVVARESQFGVVTENDINNVLKYIDTEYAKYKMKSIL